MDKDKSTSAEGAKNFLKGTATVVLSLLLWTVFGWLTLLAGSVLGFETLHWSARAILLVIAIWVAARSMYPDS